MGMGLSIARTIIEAHHGLISARNQVHGGASFRIRLPLVRNSHIRRTTQTKQYPISVLAHLDMPDRP